MKFRLHWIIGLKIFAHWFLAVCSFGLWLPVAIHRSFYWWCFEQGINSSGLYKRAGIISRNIISLNLRSLEGISVEQSFWQRVFNLGTVRVKGQGMNSILLTYLHNPVAVAQAINHASL